MKRRDDIFLFEDVTERFHKRRSKMLRVIDSHTGGYKGYIEYNAKRGCYTLLSADTGLLTFKELGIKYKGIKEIYEMMRLLVEEKDKNDRRKSHE